MKYEIIIGTGNTDTVAQHKEILKVEYKSLRLA